MGMCAITFCCPLFCICSLCAGGTVGGATQCCCQTKVNREAQGMVPIQGPDGTITYQPRSYTYQQTAPLPLGFPWIGSSLVSLIIGIILYIELAKKCGESYNEDVYYWDTNTNSSVYNGTRFVEGPGFSLNPLHTEGERCWSTGNSAYFGLGFFASIFLAIGTGFLITSLVFFCIYGKQGVTCPFKNSNGNQGNNQVYNISPQVIQNTQVSSIQNMAHGSIVSQPNNANYPSFNNGVELQTLSPSRQSNYTAHQATYNELSNSIPSHSYAYPSTSNIQVASLVTEEQSLTESTASNSIQTYRKDVEMNI